MQEYKNRFLKVCLCATLMSSMVMGVMGVMAGTASAATCTLGTPCSAGGVGITITGGTLSANTNSTIVNNGNAITASNADQTVPFRFLTQVSDGRGTAPGWHVSASATPLTFGTGGPTSDLFLDSSTPVTVTCAANASCIPGTLTIGAAGADLVAAPVTLVSAPAGGGRGSFNIATLGNFTVPASAGDGTATGGTIAVTVDTAP
ncbi:MAG: hypothetical protein H0V70_16215 [Ktedonobacteraceae bacterium]|nr:hypothetical protein [Ktedonobacteraceae bacterium]